MVRDVSVAAGAVELTICLTIAGCPLRVQIRDEARPGSAPCPACATS